MARISSKNQKPLELSELKPGQRLAVLTTAAGKNFAIPLGFSGRFGNSNGVDTSKATATADDVRKGKTGWANGQRIIGNRVLRIDPAGDKFYLTGCALDWVNGFYSYTVNAVEIVNGNSLIQLSGYTNDSGAFMHTSLSVNNINLEYWRIAHRDDPFVFYYQAKNNLFMKEGCVWSAYRSDVPMPPPRTTFYY